ncbi:MAG: bstEII [Bacteroidia bacterium]
MAYLLTKRFADYKEMGANWVTLTNGEYYPDVLLEAKELYSPVILLFGQLLKSSESSTALFLKITATSESWMRIQLSRVFRKYVSPEIPVEMLKKKTKAHEICAQFGKIFRPIHEVQAAFSARPNPDEALCALLWEYKDRGKKGYDLTERFFHLFQTSFPNIDISGPERAGRDILMGSLFQHYPNPNRPIDFAIKKNDQILAIGLARYDGDRGGAQEDDRIGGYANCANEFLTYTKKMGLNTKIIFLNDGPGLLLGSMWDDYAKLEDNGLGQICVLTLRMITERLTMDWLTSN